MVAGFKRFFIPAVRFETAQGVVSNLAGDGVLMEWEVNRDNTNKVDEATVSIYNLAPALTGAIFEAWQILSAASGYLATLAIGWDGVPETVIRGDVWDFVPDRRSPTDSVAVFRIGDGGKTLRDQVVGKGFQGVKISIVLEYLVAIPPAAPDIGGGGLGLIYPPESKALVTAAAAELPVQTWGNIPKGANTREAVNLIMDTLGLEWRVHNGEFVVMRAGVINKPGPLIRPGTGLISYERRNDGGVIFSALANPEVEPGVQVLVQDDFGKPFGEPVYRVERVSFTGSTAGESLMDVEAAKVVTI
jgi:hypothetical protein